MKKTTSTKTRQAIIDFINFCAEWAKRDSKEDKFNYAIRRVFPRAVDLHRKTQEAREDINVENCAVDKEGLIRKDAQGGYEFSKEQLKKRNKEQRALYEETVEIEPYFATQVPKDLTLEERMICAGFVIKEEE